MSGGQLGSQKDKKSLAGPREEPQPICVTSAWFGQLASVSRLSAECTLIALCLRKCKNRAALPPDDFSAHHLLPTLLLTALSHRRFCHPRFLWSIWESVYALHGVFVIVCSKITCLAFKVLLIVLTRPARSSC